MHIARVIAAVLLSPFVALGDGGWFGIRVVDEATGDGVPLAELRTVNQVALVTDNAGWAAFQEPGLMEREVFFSLSSPGYEMRADGFGFRGVRLTPKAGGTATVKMRRTNIAQRVGRLTGGALFRDSELLGKQVPVPNVSPVLGQDSVQGARYNGRLFFLWGDTNVAGYPLGNFRTTSATLPPDAKPADGLRYEYLMEKEKPAELRKMLPLDGPGAVWMFGLHALKESTGRDVLLAGFGVYPGLAKPTRQGVARFDETSGVFVPVAEINKDEAWRFPRGVAVEHKGYVYFASPFLHTRVAANVADFTNPARYEALWFDREAKAWKWQTEHAPTTQADAVPPEHARFSLTSPEGKPVRIHTASIQWNAWRSRWVMVGVQSGGKGDPSALGEVWYAESTEPDGPWTMAVKVASHPRYTYYNPVHHDFFDSEGGRVIWFEGTYTKEFSGNPEATPRYDYNQLMYRLDLADPALAPAQDGRKK